MDRADQYRCRRRASCKPPGANPTWNAGCARRLLQNNRCTRQKQIMLTERRLDPQALGAYICLNLPPPAPLQWDSGEPEDPRKAPHEGQAEDPAAAAVEGNSS